MIHIIYPFYIGRTPRLRGVLVYSLATARDTRYLAFPLTQKASKPILYAITKERDTHISS